MAFHQYVKIRTLLLWKVWFTFDFDDTLHEFNKVSGIAAPAAFEHMETYFGIVFADLKSAYSGILSLKTANAFADGKGSDEYRKEGFAALVTEFDVVDGPKLLDGLAQIYNSALGDTLEAKNGALDLIANLKSIKKKVAFIRDGPQDVQEWTVEKLRFDVDFLATTNFFRTPKIDGLFAKGT